MSIYIFLHSFLDNETHHQTLCSPIIVNGNQGTLEKGELLQMKDMLMYTRGWNKSIREIIITNMGEFIWHILEQKVS